MSSGCSNYISRRGFLKWTGASSLALAVGGGGAFARALARDKNAIQEVGRKYKYSICDMCFNKCGVIARVEDGIVKKLDPNPQFIKSRGMLCAKGNAGIRQLYDPDRLKYPLLRKGDRGEGRWQRLSWDEALDLAAQKLKEIGEKYTRCGTVFMAGSDIQSRFVHRFAEVYGSYNILTHEGNCLLSRNRAFVDTFGEVPHPDVRNCKYIIMAGANRFESLVTPDSIDLMEAMRDGCKLVVLDPRHTKTAALAHEWYPIRPGTDMAFFLAITHVLINEGIYDKKFVEEKTFGFNELSQHVKQYTPEWAEKECEIPATHIRRIARELAAAAPAAMVYPGRRSSDYENSTQIRRSFAIVNALLGNWDRPGGLLASPKIPIGNISYDAPFYDDNPEDRADMGRSQLMFEEEGAFKHMRDAILEQRPYPIKGFFTYKINPVQTGANRNKTLKMISKLEFMITVDIQMTDTAWMADLVLPAPSYLERKDPVSVCKAPPSCVCAVYRDPVVKPLYDTKPVFWIVKELASRLELGEFFDFSIDDMRSAQLKAFPQAMKGIKEKGFYNIRTDKAYGLYDDKPFRTLSKKIELFSKRYESKGIDPLPVYKPPRKVPPGKFRIVVGKNAYFTHCSTQNNILLHELMPENELWIHPASASKLRLKQGDLVEVSSPAGKGKLRVRVTAETRQDTVYMDSGFGVISKGLTNIYGKGACIADILEDYCDRISGNMAMHETIVEVRKI